MNHWHMICIFLGLAVLLDFGAGMFNGQARWLAIGSGGNIAIGAKHSLML